MLLGVAYSFVIPFSSLFGTREVGLRPMAFGLFMTTCSLGSIVCSTVLARWSDMLLPRRSVLLIGGVAGTLGYLGYAFVRDVRLLTLIGVGLLGLASVIFSQLFACARDLLGQRDVERSELPLYMNVFRLSFALSWTVGPAIGAWVMRVASFRGLYLVASGFFALFVLLVASALPPLTPSAETRSAAKAQPLLRTLGTPGLLAYFAAFVLYFSTGTMGMMNLPLLLVNTLGGNESQVGIAFSVAPIFELPLMIVMGVLATRMPARRLIQGALLVAVVYYVILAFVRVPAQVYPAQFLSAAIVAVTSGVAITFFQDFLPNQPGTATNLYSNAQRIGSTAGYLCFGVLTEAFGARGVFVTCSIISVCALAILFAGSSLGALESRASVDVD